MWLVISGLGVAQIACVTSLVRTRRGLRQLQSSVNSIDAYAPLDGDPPPDLPTQLQPLAMSVQSLLARFEAERSFERGQLSAACHEIRSPLTALQTVTELLMNRLEAGQEPIRSSAELELARRNVRRISVLIDDVLALSLTAHADHPLAALGPNDIVDIVRREAAVHNRLIPVTASVTSALVVGDARRLRWAISNLISNATEHCVSQVEVGVSSDQTEDGRPAVSIQVMDDGSGLEEQDPERLLLRFRRGPNASEKGVGGLGLTIVQSVVDDHDGEIWIQPKGQLGGATFTIVLPLATAPAAEETPLGQPILV